MDYIFSNNIQQIKPSAADKMLEQMCAKDLISLAGGNPSSDVFPVRTIEAISSEILRENPIDVLQYSVTEGDAELRKNAYEFMVKRGSIFSEEDDLMVTSGSQQIPDLVAKCFCNAGDYVLVENPSYYLTLDTFRGYGVNLVGIPMESDGMNTDFLEKEIIEKKPKVLYCIPNYHNPTGITTSLQKRKKIYELCVENDVLILEDDPYGDIAFDGNVLPNIKSLDENGIVILAKSFSKIIAPGIRVSMCVANQNVIKKMIIAKRCTDVHSSVWSQKICAKILKEIDMDEHITSLQNYYGKKATFMQEMLQKHIGDYVTWIRPQGGMFLWMTLADEFDMPDVVQRLIDRKVAVVPGNIFYVDQNAKCNNIRLNFSTPSESNIEKAFIEFEKVMKDIVKK